MATDYATLLMKRRDADAWASAALPLASGEWGYDETNRVTKIGDGFTPWADLPEHLTAAVDGQLPDTVRSALASNLSDPDTVEGAAVAAAGAGLPFDDESGLYLDASENPIPSVDAETKQLPDKVRARIAANLADPTQPEGAAIAAAITASGGNPGSVPAVLMEVAVPDSAFAPDANTVALYHLENNGADASGNGYTATPETAYATPTFSSAAARFGQYGMSGPALRVPDAAVAFMSGTPSPAYTIEAWVRTTVAALMVAVGRGSAFYLGQDASGNALCAYQTGGNTRQITSSKKINDGSFHHIALAVSADGAGAKLFVDNVVVGSDSTAGGNVGTSNPLTIGSMGPAYLWNGQIDEVRISNVARGASSQKAYPPRPGLNPGMVTYIGSSTPTDMVKGDAWRKLPA